MVHAETKQKNLLSHHFFTDAVAQRVLPHCLLEALKTEPKCDVALILHTQEQQLSKQHRVCSPAYSCI